MLSRRFLSVFSTPRYVRFSSSSSCNNKLQLESADTQTSTTADKEKKETSTEKIHFMPVINIPETELAHHAFFSLHRPLLGLSDDERPFFSGKSTEEYNQDKLDMELQDYLLDRQPFDTPLPPGQKTIEPKTEITIELEQEVMIDDSFEDIRQEPIPVFHMPESNDILDFLSTVENKLKREHDVLEAKESRQRKIEMIKRFHAAKRRHNK